MIVFLRKASRLQYVLDAMCDLDRYIELYPYVCRGAAAACRSAIMEKQGNGEPMGQTKLTLAYNLPCSYVLYTVGPIIYDSVTQRDQELLASCYRSCLELAQRNRITSVAFCCISTGEFHFPNDLAAEIAVRTVWRYRGDTEVIFHVFKDANYRIYRELLG